MLVDTHAHLYDKEFLPEIEAIIHRAIEKDVQRMYMPNVDQTSIDSMMEIESKYGSHCHAMMGLHPCYVKKDFERELYIVENWLSKRKFAAIGEIGLDLYWDKSFFNQQLEALKIQLQWAKLYDLPIVIHCRNSMDETISCIQSTGIEQWKGIFHCFSGTLEQANKVIEMGFKLGIGGVLTFKNGGLESIVKEISLDKLVLETDSPYLAPVPFRGKQNEPSYLPLIAEKLSIAKSCSLEEVALKTTNNALNLFKSIH